MEELRVEDDRSVAENDAQHSQLQTIKPQSQSQPQRQQPSELRHETPNGRSSVSPYFDVTLNIVDVISDFDEESHRDSSAASSSFPDLIPGVEYYSSHHQHYNNSEQSTTAEHQPKEAESLQPTRLSQQSVPSSSHHSSRSCTNSPPEEPEAFPSPGSRAEIIIRHFRLVILSDLFFILGSILFLCASIEQYQQSNDKQLSSEESAEESPESPGDEKLYQSLSPTSAPTSGGYHLQISTSIDTWVTNQMLLMISASFCFLQVGIINFVRTPLDKFHCFQMLAGLFGLVSAMFSETRDIVSIIAYFFFVHAMTGQALLQLHSHYWKVVAPTLAERKKERKIRESNNAPGSRSPRFPQVSPTHSRSLDDPSRVIIDRKRLLSSTRAQDASNHDDDGGRGFALENSFSFEDQPDPTHAPTVAQTTSTHGLVMGPAEQLMIEQGLQITAAQDEEQQRKDDEDATFRYGIVFCGADFIFILGSTMELVLTYVDILSLSNKDSEDTYMKNGEVRLLHLLPGVLWCTFSTIALVATILLHRSTAHIMYPSHAPV